MNPLQHINGGVTLAALQPFQDWSEALSRYRYLMTSEAYMRLSRQQEAFSNDALPKIADEVIKKIPIKEEKEGCFDISVVNNPRIQMLPDPTESFAHPGCNSGCFQAAKVRRRVFFKLEQTIQELDKIAPEFGYAKRQISIKIFEGYRNSKTQQKLFEKKYGEIRQANPSFSDQEVISETLTWASPVDNNIPAHTTGAAVDIRLYDEKKGQLLDLGQYGVFWGDNPISSTFLKEVTAEQFKNRLLLAIAANNAGFVNYPYEYWHFSTGDRYAAYWDELPVACYGQLTGSFRE